MKILCLLLSIILILSAIGCNSAETGTTAQLDETSVTQIKESSAITDESSKIPDPPAIPVREEYIPEVPDEYKGMEIQEGGGIVDYMIGPTADDIIAEADYMVLATVEGFENVYFSTFPWTIIKVSVDDVIIGDFESDQALDIYTYGGYIPLRQHLGDSLYAHGTTKTEEEIDNTVIHITDHCYGLPEIGKQYIFMLTYRELAGEMVYENMMGKYSRLEVLDDYYLYKIPADESEPAIISFDQFEEKIELYKNETVEIK